MGQLTVAEREVLREPAHAEALGLAGPDRELLRALLSIEERKGEEERGQEMIRSCDFRAKGQRQQGQPQQLQSPHRGEQELRSGDEFESQQTAAASLFLTVMPTSFKVFSAILHGQSVEPSSWQV